jgi:glutamate synthase (NADPH/NADH) small chain
MGKATGFLEYKGKNYTSESFKNRTTHYREFLVPPKENQIATQAARCMECSIPFCHSSKGCPVDNLIPEWNDLVYKNLWQEAYFRLESTNNFPEFTGRLCPAPCETACTLSINDSPVTIKQIELSIIEKAFKNNWVTPQKPTTETGKKIAVIGSGPAGLAAAQQLRRAGHTVTVFEKSGKIGGLLRYGIPDFKLEKSIIDRRLKQLETEGVIFETHIDIGEDISARYLQRSFDVILLAMGAGKAREIDVPGRQLNGIYRAMDYLTLSNKYVDGTITKSKIISAKDKKVLVLGGGDTGADCVGTANRQGAKAVVQYEIMPKPLDWKHNWNPNWPEWPNILRTSSSHEEGCYRDWSILTKEFTGNNNHLAHVAFKKVLWQPDPDNGRHSLNEIENSEFTQDMDMVILAVGFEHVEHNRLLKELKIDFDGRGNISTDDSHQTNIPGIFSAGDAATGASLVVTAIKEGRAAAESIND